MNNFIGLAHLCILTKNIEKSIRFYHDYLGFEEIYHTVVHSETDKSGFHPLQYSLIRLGECLIEILEPSDKNTINDKFRGVIDHIGIEVKGIEEAVEKMKARGFTQDIKIVTNETLFKKPFKAAGFVGPDGEGLALYEFDEGTY